MSTSVDHKGRPRVAITALGIKSPAGLDVESSWERVLEGRSTAARLTRFDPTPLAVDFGCEVVGFNAEDYVDKKEARRLDRVTALSVGAATDAIAAAGDLGADPARVGVMASTGVGGLETFSDQFGVYFGPGPDRVSPFFIPMMMPNASAGLISIRNGFTGPALCISTACAAGTNAIGDGARLIRDGTCDVVVAGGGEAPLVPLAIAAFARMGALSKRNDDPEHASRPFDATRDGFVMGEGAGIVVLESLEHARARGARIYAEVVGYGLSGDAYHITAPSEDGDGAYRCMRMAVKRAGITVDEIDYVNAHGTSTMGDEIELGAVERLFGNSAGNLTLSSTKSAIGHLLGAAGSVEAIFSILAMRDNIVPPTINLDNPSVSTPIDLVPHTAKKKPINTVLSNSFGFGGTNASLIMRRLDA